MKDTFEFENSSKYCVVVEKHHTLISNSSSVEVIGFDNIEDATTRFCRNHDRDFFQYWFNNEKYFGYVLADEDGYTRVSLRKWEDFDKHLTINFLEESGKFSSFDDFNAEVEEYYWDDDRPYVIRGKYKGEDIYATVFFGYDGKVFEV